MASSQDFLAIVEEYLSRDQIYHPADEFVMKLALSQHFIARPRRSNVSKTLDSRWSLLLNPSLTSPGGAIRLPSSNG